MKSLPRARLRRAIGLSRNSSIRQRSDLALDYGLSRCPCVVWDLPIACKVYKGFSVRRATSKL
jgi:hypothetical protein